MRFQRTELTDYLQRDHEVIQQFLDNQRSKVNSVEKTMPLWKPNESDLIKTKLKDDISRTWHVQYIYIRKAASLDTLQPLIKIQRSGLNSTCTRT